MHFCHTSAKIVTKLAVSSATHVSGQTAKKIFKEAAVLGLARVARAIIFVFSSQKQVQPSLVKMQKISPTGQTLKKPFSCLEAGQFFASAFHRALDSKQKLVFNEPLFAALRKTKFSVAAREL